MNKKGITPTIAILILLSVTISSAGSAFYWLNNIQSTITSEHERFDVVDFSVTGAEVGILASDLEQTQLTIFIKNIGKEIIAVRSSAETPTTAWLLKDVDDKVICASDWSGQGNGPICQQGCDQDLAPGELRKIILGNLDGLCNIVDKPTDSVFLYEIDFSGATKSEGSFVK
jgi:flagellin-like protein